MFSLTIYRKLSQMNIWSPFLLSCWTRKSTCTNILNHFKHDILNFNISIPQVTNCMLKIHLNFKIKKILIHAAKNANVTINEPHIKKTPTFDSISLSLIHAQSPLSLQIKSHQCKHPHSHSCILKLPLQHKMLL